MSSTVIQLYNGELNILHLWGLDNPEMRHLERLIERNCKRLEDYLCEEAKNILEAYCSCVNEYMALAAEQTFHTGFCLGTRLAAEALIETE